MPLRACVLRAVWYYRLLILFDHSVSARVLAYLGRDNENVVLTKLAYLAQKLGSISSRQNDEYHIHFVGRAVTVQNGITAVALFEIRNYALRVFVVCDEL